MEMIYEGYSISEETAEFIEEMEGIIECLCGFVIESSYYGMSLDPVEDYIEIWHLGEHITNVSSIKDLLLNFEVNGKKLIEIIEDFDFA